MVTDLHNHTYFSYDGSEQPDAIVDNAVAVGIDVIGISDHQFTEGFDFDKYISTLRGVKNKWQGVCDVKIGLEIGTRPKPCDLLAKSVSKHLDYCLFESLDSEKGMDIFEFLQWRQMFGCPVGLAHTDIFALSERYGLDMLQVLKREEIFWEINTSGNYTYYYDFITNGKKRAAVKNSGITLSVGSDTHQLYNFNPKKIISANRLAETLGNRIIFGKRW